MTIGSSTNDQWTELTFSEAVQVNPGVSLKRGEVYPFVDMVSVDVGQRTVNGIEEREFKGSGSKFQNGDTLMARITPCLENGKIARYKPLGDQQQAHGSTEFIVLRGRPGTTTDDFAYYLTRWEEVRQYAIGQMTGTSGRQRVPVDSLDHLTIPIPPLPEQRAIAHFLGTLDDKIELNRRMNHTLEATARAIFQDWFVDFGPVRAKLEGQDPYLPPKLWDLFPEDLVNSELGEIPEGWGVETLSEVVTHLRTNENPGKYPDTLFSHFSIPAYDQGQVPKQDPGGSIKSSKTVVQPGVVLLSKLNPEIERVWLVDVAARERAICSTEFLVLSPRLPFPRSYVYCYFQTPVFRDLIQTLVTGTSRSHQRAQPNSILSLPAIIPSAPVIDAFDQQAEAFLAMSLTYLRGSTALAAQRNTLLPKLVSGEVRVS